MLTLDNPVFVIEIALLLALLLGAILLNTRIYLFVLIVGIAYPYRFPSSVPFLRSFSTVEIYAVLGLAIALVRSFQRRRVTLSVDFPGLSYAVLALFTLLSIGWARNDESVFRLVIIELFRLCLFFVMVSLLRDESDIRWARKCLDILMVIAILIAIVFFFTRWEVLNILPNTTEDDLYSSQIRLGMPAWGRSNYFASIILIGTLLWIARALIERKRPWVWIPLATLGTVSIFWTLSVGGIVGLLIGFLLLLFHRDSSRRFAKTVWVLLLFALVFLVSLALMNSSLPEYVMDGVTKVFHLKLQNLANPFTIDRVLIVNQAWKYFLDSPFLGVGPGNTFFLGHTIDNAHNAYLQNLAELGIPGLALFLVFVGALLRDFYGYFSLSRGTRWEAEGIGSLAVLVSLLLNIAGEATFEGVVFGWVFFIFIGIVESHRRLLKTTYVETSQQISFPLSTQTML